MFLFSLSWRQGWVGFTCTDSCSVTLRLLYVFSCACFHLHTIRMHFIYHSCCSRFMWILYFICMCGKKLIPSSRYIHSIYQCPLLPVSFLPGWMSTLPLCGCSLQWVFLSQLSTASHDVSSTEAPSLPMMISGFISISEDGFQISILDSKFILDIYHTFIHSSVQVCYFNFHLFDVLNGAAGPGLGCVVFQICSLLK